MCSEYVRDFVNVWPSFFIFLLCFSFAYNFQNKLSDIFWCIFSPWFVWNSFTATAELGDADIKTYVQRNDDIKTTDRPCLPSALHLTANFFCRSIDLVILRNLIINKIPAGIITCSHLKASAGDWRQVHCCLGNKTRFLARAREIAWIF